MTLYAVWNALLGIEGDPAAEVSGGDVAGYVLRPSAWVRDVVVLMPDGFDPSKVTVEVSPEVATLLSRGAKIRVVNGGHDITAYLDIPGAGGTQFIASATVKQSIADETLDPTKGASFSVDGGVPSLTTARTRPGLVYTLREGTELGDMKDGASTLGDGQPWTPKITVKGGASGFYTIRVEK